MKKTLFLIAATVLILNATGCGSCRNLFGFRHRANATPVIGSVQNYAPICSQPSCCPQPCDSCGIDGSAVSYGYDGGAPIVVEGPAATSDCNCGQ